jgi:hypothetical protein
LASGAPQRRLQLQKRAQEFVRFHDIPPTIRLVGDDFRYFIGGIMPDSANPVQHAITIIELDAQFAEVRMCAREAILYEAETLARSDQKVKHSKPQVTNPKCSQIGNESARI